VETAVLGVFTAKIFLSALIIGIFLGTVYAIVALGMVAAYRINRVVNLAQAGTAVFGATIYWWMTNIWGAPVIVSLFGGVLAAGAVGALLGIANLHTSHWPRGFVMILTLTATLLLFAVSDNILPPQTVSPASPFGEDGFNVALTYVSYHQIGTFLTCLGVTLAASWTVRKSRAGMYVRAIYDDAAGASTVGVPTSYFVVGVWAFGGALAGLAGILVSPRTTLDSVLLLFVTVYALAGAILGGLESFAIAFAGSMILGISQGIIGGVFAGSLGPGLENLSAVALMAAGVFYAGVKRRDLAHIQT
jgi:branched-chain amino acid transport system permease protein